MARANGAQSHYFTLEARLFRDPTVTPVERLTMISLCVLAAEHNQIGVFRLDATQLLSVAQSMQLATRHLHSKALFNALELLENRGWIKRYGGGELWIKDYWSYRGTRSNSKHQQGAKMALALYPSVLVDFEAHYGKLIGTGIGNPIGNTLAEPVGNDIANAIQYKHKHKQENNNGAFAPAADKPPPTTGSGKKPIRPQPTPSEPPPTNCVRLAERICNQLDKAKADGLLIVDPRDVQVFARFIERAEVEPRLLGEAWLWGWNEERGYWRSQMLHMASWGQPKRWQTLVNQYLVSLGKGAEQPTGQPPGPPPGKDLDAIFEKRTKVQPVGVE